MVAVLLAGLFLRSAAFGPMGEMLHYDEAYDAVDALSLLRSPRLTPFLPGNFGRESGWSYLLAPFLAVFGARPFALRLAAAMTGVLTVAAFYGLAKQILGGRGAFWAAAVLSVLYWHVHLSHLALRAILFPLAGAITFAWLLGAHRSNALHRWALAGLGLGLLAYTYFSAYLWILYALVTLVFWFAWERAKRRGVLVALGIAAVAFLPMALYTVSHPAQVLGRPGGVGVLDAHGIAANLRLWAQAWFQRGDPNAEFNLPHRPILDAGLGILLVAGLVALPLVAGQRWHGPWVAGWALFSVLPSLLSNQAPHFLRAVGLTLPIALVAGAGAVGIQSGLERQLRVRGAGLAPLLLLAAAATATYRDFHVRWLQHPEVFVLMEQHLQRAISFLRASTPADMPVYFSPLSPDHPVLLFRAGDLAPRHVAAFDSHYCQVASDRPAAYVSLTVFEPDFRDKLSSWADVDVLLADRPKDGASPRFTVFRAVPRPGALRRDDPARAVFGKAVALYPLSALSPTADPGSTIVVRLGIRALEPLDRPYSVFVHLYGQPTPYEGGVMWSQGDCQICPSYPAMDWSTEETIIQGFSLPVPADCPPGQYQVAIGVYEAPSGPRLPVTAPSPRPWDYVVLQEVQVGDGAGASGQGNAR